MTAAALLITCCCNVDCWHVARICSDQKGPPEVALRCRPDLTTGVWRVAIFSAVACYRINIDQIYEEQPPDMPVGNPLMEVRDCDACLQACFVRGRVCGCTDESAPCGEVYMRCEDVDGVTIRRVGNCCFAFDAANVVDALPPGAVLIEGNTPYSTCEECCGSEPGCPVICLHCPNTITGIIGSSILDKFCGPGFENVNHSVPGAAVPAERNGSCQWDGVRTLVVAASGCPNFPDPFETMPYAVELACGYAAIPGDPVRWSALVTVDQAVARYAGPFAYLDNCPIGGLWQLYEQTGFISPPSFQTL